MLLFILYLYQTLPQFLPKTTIILEGTLGQKITKNIQLKNPSNKTIIYSVEYSGSPDFKVNSKEISLQPGGTLSYPIEFISRFSKSVKGKIVFSNKRDSGLGAAAMVFLLESQITSRPPLKTIKYESDLYIPREIDIVVENPFNRDSKFDITIDQKFTPYVPPVSNKPKAHKVRNNANANFKPLASVSPDQSSLSRFDKDKIFDKVDAYTCKEKKLQIQANGSTHLILNFLPFFRGKYECNILFLDNMSGEFLYQCIAEVNNPPLAENIKIVSDLLPLVQKTIIFPPNNKYLDDSREHILEDFNGTAKTRARDILKRAQDDYKKGTTNFKVECSSPYFSTEEVIPMQLTEENKLMTNVEVSNSMKINGKVPNVLTLSFQPREAGKYKSNLLLTNGSDCRYYIIEAVVNDKNTKAEIQFCAPAGQKIKQAIPLVNNTDEEWNLISILDAQYFKGPKSLKLQPHSDGKYDLEFSPPWLCDVEGELTLVNEVSGEKFYFGLKGKGEDPLSLDNIELKCNARETLNYDFSVTNNRDTEQTYNIECDLPHISGESSITVPGLSTGHYTLSITPLLAGIYSGSITFVGDDDRYQWYTIEITVSPAPPMDIIEATSVVRQNTSVMIQLSNPLEDPIDFDVEYTGEGLMGQENFHLEPLSEGIYELYFIPLVVGEQEGNITFTNFNVGEYWYKLHLIAEQAEPIVLPELSCAVGSKCTTSFMIENPLAEEVLLKAAISNGNNYKVSPSRFTLKPGISRRITVEYFPSSINKPEPCDISFVFLGRKIGDIQYKANGHGLEPGLMDKLSLACIVNDSTPGSLFFHNPFPLPLTINIELEIDEKYKNIITLLLKKYQQVVPQFGNSQIPILFSPKEITTYKAFINITTTETSDKLKWSYPIEAIAEAPKCESRYEFRCRAREVVNETLDIKLHGITEITQTEYFEHEIILPEEYQSLLGRIISIEPLMDNISSINQLLRYQIKFTPTKPLNFTGSLLLKKKSGGRWRYDLLFDVVEPLVDDVITIEAPMNQTASVTFNITNQYPEPAKYEAYFSPDTPIEFSVNPIKGELKPYGSEGTPITVSFSPKEYGNMLLGKLIITTNDMMVYFILYF